MRLRRLAMAGALLAVAAVAFMVATAILDEDPPAERPEARARAERRDALPPVRASTRVRALARSLPIEARVAQLFLVGFEGTDVSAPIFTSVQDQGWGGVVIGPDNLLWPEAVAGLAGELAVRAAGSGVLRPLVVAEEHPSFPPQRGVTSPREAEAAARAAAEGLAAMGVHAVLDPQADLAVPAGPSASSGFSDDERIVAPLVGASVRGWLAGGVLPVVEHFPGQGAASQEPMEGPSVVGAEPEVGAFTPALRRAPAVVVSNAAYTQYDPVTPATFVPAIVRDLLRAELGFRGVAITDDLAGAAASTGGTMADAAVRALRAGCDMVQVHDEAARDSAYRRVLAAAKSGRIPRARLREALLRVLKLKERAGLL